MSTDAPGLNTAMKWYIAHVIMYFKFKDGNQNKFPIWENLILVQGQSKKEAFEKAKAKSISEEGDDSGSLRVGDRAACMTFGGIRKLVECEDADQMPGDGTEVSYSRLEVKTEEDFMKLIKGELVDIEYVE